MAGVNEELKIRIVPELDKGALKSVQDELNAISPKVPIGSAGGGAGGSVVADLKAQQVEMKKVFDGIQQRLIQEDILLRTTRIRLQREIEGIRQQGAQGKITNDQMLQGVAKLESEMVSAADNARNAYQGLAEEIGRTASQFKDVEGVLQSLQGVDKELSVRVVPELDKAAIKSVEDQISAIKPKAPIAVPVSVGGVADMKAQQAEMKKVFDGIQQRLIQEDILLRTTRMRIQREIELTRQQGAQGKITNEQMIQSVNALEAESVDAANNTRIAYDALNQEIGYTASQFQNVDGVLKQTNRVQSKLLVNTGHLDSGFVTMATSLDKITSQTKNTNLAFMNMGRIVQDAPFGLIGIANNIDPMVVTFSNLANEIDDTTGKVRGFGGALSAMGKQLLGPAGIIFLLGSAIPSALLVLQKRQREAAKEADVLGDAFKKVADEFARLATQAASNKGIGQVTKELGVVNTELDIANKQLAKMKAEFAKIAEEQSRALAAAGAPRQAIMLQEQVMIGQLREQNKERLTSLDRIIKTLTTQKESLDTNKQEIEDRKFIREEAGKRGTAEIFFLEERQKQTKKLHDLEIRTIELTDEAQAEVLRNIQKLKEEIKSIASDPDLFPTKQAFTAISAIRKEITNLESGVSPAAKKTSDFIDRTLEKQALLRIAYQNNIDLSQDENRTYEERQQHMDLAIVSRRQELVLQRQSVQAQLILAKDEQTQIGLRVQLINLGQESVELNRQAAKFAQERADALFQEWSLRQQNIMALQEEIRIMEQRSLDEVIPLPDVDTSNLDLRLNLARESIDRQTQYEIDAALSVGNKIMALEIEKNAFLLEEYQKHINAKYSEEQAMAMAMAETNKEFAHAERDVRKEAFSDTFQAAGELASQALTAIFGDSKEVAIAQVIIDTAMGIQKIWSQSGMNPIVGGLLTAALAAKGVTAIQKIRNTEVGGGSGVSSSGSAERVPDQTTAASVLGARRGDNVLRGSGDRIAAMASPMGTDMQNISITASVDRRGLAIAVREGERQIRTVQTPYA